MRIFLFFLFLVSVCFPAQKQHAFDSLKLKDASDFFADDYGNIYLYKKQDFSFTKYDSLGKQLGKVMMTVPFRVQSVQNPLNIFLFSENNQELKMLDVNLNEIQRVDFRSRFGFVKTAYTEDLQQIWLLDESMKRFVQYNYRNDSEINSFPLNLNFDLLTAILVFDRKLYTISENQFSVYDFRGNLLFQKEVTQPRKLYRQNDTIYIVCEKDILKYGFQESLETVFSSGNAQIVDKNSSSFFELKEGKLYLYPIKN